MQYKYTILQVGYFSYIYQKEYIFIIYIYKGHGVKGPIPHCRGLGGPQGPPVLCKKMQEDAGSG